ncbi:MAG: hypothetical protein WD990_11850, partial [Acidimicrobiia bacterium]
MRHLVIPSDGGSGADHALSVASDAVGPHGTLILISVLPGSLVERHLSPPERGRRRRVEENRAKAALFAQVARSGLQAECHVIALFGVVVSDTLLIVGNLGADGIVMDAGDPDLQEMLAASPVPVLVVPAQAEAP